MLKYSFNTATMAPNVGSSGLYALVGYSRFVANTVAGKNAYGMQENEECVFNAAWGRADIREGSM